MSFSLSDILRATDAPAWVWGADGTVLGANASLVRLAGIDPTGQTDWAGGLAQLRNGMSGRVGPDGRLPEGGATCPLPLPTNDEGPLLHVCRLRPIGGGDLSGTILVTCETRSALHPLGLASDTAGVALFTLDPQTQAISVNGALRNMLGYPQVGPLQPQAIDAVLPVNWLLGKLVDPESMGSTVTTRDHCFRDSTGRLRWISVTAGMLAQPDGSPSLLCGWVSDTTQQKMIDDAQTKELERTRTELESRTNALEEIRSENDMLRFAIQAGRIGPFSYCPDTSEYWLMDEARELMGYDDGGAISTIESRLALIHPDHRDEAQRLFTAMVDGKTDTYDYESRQMHADGTYHWYRSIGRMVDRSHLDLPPIVTGATFEIDGLKENEIRLADALKHAENLNQQMNQLADNAPTAIYEVHAYPDGRIEMPFFSANMPDFFGIEAQDLRDDPATTQRHMPAEDADALNVQIALAHEACEKMQMKVRVNHPERGLIWLQIASNPHLQADGTVVSFASVTDISQQMEAKQRAKDAAKAAQAAHDRLNLIAENSPVGLYEFRIDANRTASVPYFNGILADLMGVSADEVKRHGASVIANLYAEDAELMQDAIRASRRALSPFELQFRVRHPERGVLRLFTRSIPHHRDDGSTVWYGSVFDLTERLELEQKTAQAAQELQQTHERLTAIADAAPVGLFECTLGKDGEASYDYTSKRFKDVVGIGDGSPAETRNAVEGNIHPDDLAAFKEAQSSALNHSDTTDSRYRLIHPEWGQRWISVRTMPRQRDGQNVLTGVYTDITKDVEREEDLRHAHELADRMRRENEHQALHDPLTGLPNRRYFERVLNQRFSEANKRPNGDGIVLVRIDGDRFKYVNDTFGHDAGDEVLRHIAEIIRTETREDCFPARIGGDEFSIIAFPGADEEAASGLIEKIRGRLAEPLLFEGRHCRIEASFGIASVNPREESGADLLAYADAALYEAKAQGRNRLELFTPALREALTETRRVAGELQDALTEDTFEPFYQAQIDTQHGVMSGVEVLIRWRHPERGILSPGVFMPVAEQLRIVPDLDRLMLRKAHADLLDFREQGIAIPKVSLNVSAGRMRDANVVDAAQRLIDDGVKVTFELLESALVEEADDVFKFNLDLLREQGVDIEIDDFGSGHASIIALMAIQPSSLKIDRRLVQNIAQSRKSRNLVRKILEIAETLEIGTIAEGVETAEQVNVLKRMNCFQVQGYHYSPPISREDFGKLLRAPTWGESGGTKVA